MYRAVLLGAWDLDPPCRIPNDVAIISNLAGDPTDEVWQQHGPAVMSMFDLSKDGKYYTNEKQMECYRKAKEKRRSSQERGSKGGKSKRDKALGIKQINSSAIAKLEPRLSTDSEQLQPKPSLQPNPTPTQHQPKGGIVGSFERDGVILMEERDAEALPPLALARKVAEELCITLDRNGSMLNSISGAVEFCVKVDGMTNSAAVQRLIRGGRVELDQGRAPNRFWFDDRKWRDKEKPAADEQGGHFEGTTYVTADGRRMPGYTPPPKAKARGVAN